MAYTREMLKGVFAPIVTPFIDEMVQYDDVEFNIAKYNQTDLKGYMPLGSNGEFQGLTDDESLRILSIVMQTKTEDKVVVAGCGRESAKATVEYIEKVASLGLDLAFILAPHYFVSRMTDEALTKYFFYVADKSPIPLVIYNAPKFAAELSITPELMAELALHPNIIAMKNSSLTPNSLYKKAIPKDSGCELIAGNIKTFYPGLVDGCIGGVLSTASYLPEYCCRLFDLYTQEKFDEAAELHAFLNELSFKTVGKFGVAGVKCGLDLRGWRGKEMRIPLLPVTPEQREEIRAYFEKVGISLA